MQTTPRHCVANFFRNVFEFRCVCVNKTGQNMAKCLCVHMTLEINIIQWGLIQICERSA